MTGTSVGFTMSQPTIDGWAVLSGDHNPLHVSPEFARETQFGGTIAHGHFSLAVMEGLMLRLVGERWLHGGALRDVRFLSPVRPGGAFDVVAEPDAGSAGCEWLVEVRARADGTVAARGRAVLAEDT